VEDGSRKRRYAFTNKENENTNPHTIPDRKKKRWAHKLGLNISNNQSN
ncbi:16980_t:CDS:1, partial [Cetraspora pellucida]